MENLQKKIMEQLKSAMREKNAIARDTLRMLKSELGKAELELGHDLGEKDELAVLTRAVKTRKDSAQAYDDGGRTDLADKERAEIKIIEAFLPSQLSADETKDAITKIIAELGLTEKKQMGQVMKALKEQFAGRYDGKTASKLAGQLLG